MLTAEVPVLCCTARDARGVMPPLVACRCRRIDFISTMPRTPCLASRSNVNMTAPLVGRDQHFAPGSRAVDQVQIGLRVSIGCDAGYRVAVTRHTRAAVAGFSKMTCNNDSTCDSCSAPPR